MEFTWVFRLQEAAELYPVEGIGLLEDDPDCWAPVAAIRGIEAVHIGQQNSFESYLHQQDGG